MSPKHIFKRLFKTAAFRFCICWLAAAYIYLVYFTSHRRMYVDEAARPYVEGKQPALFAFWHGRLLMMGPAKPKGRTMHALISTHRDGEMIARTMHNLGLKTVRGSTTRGGLTAAMGAVKALQAGDNVGITPDGPRGPAMRIRDSELIKIAALAGVPVVPVSCSATRCRHMKSWDRFMLALPFGVLYYRVGAPMMTPDKAALEAQMVAITEEMDRLCAQ